MDLLVQSLTTLVGNCSEDRHAGLQSGQMGEVSAGPQITKPWLPAASGVRLYAYSMSTL